MDIQRGSNWRKWDFHIHTPYSILNNGYGFYPYEEFVNEDPFDGYVVQLFTKAIENDVAAIGITDYFSIEGYKRIRNDYLANEAKLRMLFQSDEMIERIKALYIFPNIELRIDTFVGRGAHAVNYHVLFSDKVSIDDIEQIFLNRLQLVYQANDPLPLTRNSLERIGRDYKLNNGADGDDYLIGLEQATVKYDQVLQTLKSSIFQDKYIVTIPVDEDLSLIDWTGRDYSTRKVLYQQCHCLMTSNSKTREWALAKGREADQIREFKSIKPCIWGSDAHDYDRMFMPTENRYCWIKAEPSFDGLQQILFEPDERVKIQKDRPDEKDMHQIIDYVQFADGRFQTEPVYLSDGLTCIIGGKSTGKSILLRHIASAIAPAQVREREHIVGAHAPLSVNANVLWRDGTSGERKIIYIPQSWLNRAVEEQESETALNHLLTDIVMQQDDVIAAHKILQTSISETIDTVKHQIIDYVTHIKYAEDCEDQLSTEGRSASFEKTIAVLSAQRQELGSSAGITEEILQRYTYLEQRINEENEKLRGITSEEAQLEFSRDPFVYFPSFTQLGQSQKPIYTLDAIPTVKEIVEESIRQMNAAISEIWNPKCGEAQKLIEAAKQAIIGELEVLQKEYEALKQSIALNDQLIKIDDQLRVEKKRLASAKDLEQQKNEAIIRANELKQEIIASRKKILEAYSVYCGAINAINRHDTNLVFRAETAIQKNSIFDAITALFDNRGFRPFREKYGYNLIDKDELKIDDNLFASIWEAMSNSLSYGGLSLKGGNSIQTVLERLFGDWCHIHYTIKSGDDTINQMSPGKKALVLLELIINIEKGNCPILIDQPEDDLDNRSIYTDLVQYLRRKKHERQIIVVTHNANVVIGADAEAVIIANQDGRETQNNSRRFEYRCGAIENTTPVFGADGTILPGVLNQKGIQEQICDILEGGRLAFELRRKKYFGA